MMRIVAFVLLVALTGCASTSRNVYVDPDLEPELLRSVPIAVLGIAALAGPDDLDARIVNREALTAGMVQARPDLQWIEGSETWIALGQDEAQQILDSYRSTARLGPQELQRLAVLTDRARFLMVARIDLDMDQVETDHRTRESADRVVVDVDLRGRREMSASFDLFDLETRRLVFSTQLARVDTEPGRSFEVEPLVQPPTLADVDQAIRDALPTIPLPEPPGRLIVLRRLVRDAAEQLPGSP